MNKKNWLVILIVVLVSIGFYSEFFLKSPVDPLPPWPIKTCNLVVGDPLGLHLFRNWGEVCFYYEQKKKECNNLIKRHLNRLIKCIQSDDEYVEGEHWWGTDWDCSNLYASQCEVEQCLADLKVLEEKCEEWKNIYHLR